ncbi:MAG: O-antigen ligase family protein [Prosthecobacter sp.]
MTGTSSIDSSAAASAAAGAAVVDEKEEVEWMDTYVPEQGLASFRVALLFLALYYIRPQDWIGPLEGVNIIRPVMFLWILIIVMKGERTKWRDWFNGPQDWAMGLFYFYVWWNAPSEAAAGSGMFATVVFYVLTLHALSKVRYLHGYLKLWNGCLMIVSAFGVLQSLGMDITHGRDYTEANSGRLSLGTWLANNPNALGHTVIVSLPLSYLLYFWKGDAFGRFIVFPSCAVLGLWCAWLTESKGAFLVGATLFMLVFVVGRSRIVQLFTLALALTLGVGALSFLPRMEQIGNLRADEGVMGRLLAWEQAKMAMEANSTGLGWRQFMASIQWTDGDNFYEDIPISTHSSYVQVGADLGKYGLFFWLLVLCTAMRAILTFKAQTEEEERCRRAALIILSAYLISGWMINRQYHTEYFLVAALGAAIHRMTMARMAQSPAESALENGVAPPPEDPEIAPETEQQEKEKGKGKEQGHAPPAPSTARPALAGLQWISKNREEEENDPWLQSLREQATPESKPKKTWKRLDWKDAAFGVAATWAVIELWDYIFTNL